MTRTLHTSTLESGILLKANTTGLAKWSSGTKETKFTGTQVKGRYLTMLYCITYFYFEQLYHILGSFDNGQKEGWGFYKHHNIKTDEVEGQFYLGRYNNNRRCGWGMNYIDDDLIIFGKRDKNQPTGGHLIVKEGQKCHVDKLPKNCYFGTQSWNRSACIQEVEGEGNCS